MEGDRQSDTPPSGTSTEAGAAQISEEDQLRASLYALLSRLMARPLDADGVDFLRGLSGGETPLGEAISALAVLAQRTTQVAAEEEYTVLFYGQGAGGELMPYGSRYLTGFSYEKPLADLRRALDELGIGRAEDVTDPEDHIAFVCEVMHGLITGTFGEAQDLTVQKKFFEDHIAAWAGHFFADLEKSEAAVFYMPAGTVGRLFMEIETEAFGLAE